MMVLSWSRLGPNLSLYPCVFLCCLNEENLGHFYMVVSMYKDEVEEAVRLMAYLGTILGGPVHIRNSEETYTKFWK